MHPPYRADIDGLRAVAVLGVMAFHIDASSVVGGFAGVDVFFVISGYLITQIIVRELASGTFSFLNFYERRVRRILPALIVVMLATLLYAAFVFLPGEMQALSLSQLAVLAMAANFHLWRTAGYFGQAALSQPLMHTWSLAVEEQFYLAFPLVLVAATIWFRRYRASLLAIGGLISLALFSWFALSRPTAAYYLAPFRAWELMAGALLVFLPDRLPAPRLLRETLALAGAALIAYAYIASFAAATELPLRIGCAVAGSALLIAAGRAQGPPTMITTLVSSKPLVAIGLISYPLYLWHWPLVVWWHYHGLGAMTPTGAVAIAAVSTALAVATYWLVEKPMRTRSLLPSRSRLFLGVGSTCLALALLNAWALGAQGIVRPLDAEVRQKLLINEAKTREWAYPASCHSSQASVPLPGGAVAYCPIGTDHPEKILVWGDSMMEQLYPVFERAAELGLFGRRQVVFAIASGCQPVPGLERPNYQCGAFNAAVLERAQQADITAVVIGGAWAFDARFQWLSDASGAAATLPTLATAPFTDKVAASLRAMLATLRRAQKPVAIITPFPTYPVAIPKHLQRRLLGPEPALLRLSPADVRKQNAAWTTVLEALKSEQAAALFDPAPSLCDSGGCVFERDGISLYKDAVHLTPDGSLQLLDMIRAIAQWTNKRDG